MWSWILVMDPVLDHIVIKKRIKAIVFYLLNKDTNKEILSPTWKLVFHQTPPVRTFWMESCIPLTSCKID